MNLQFSNLYKMSGYIWGLLVTLLGLLIIIITIIMYFVFKDDKNYKDNYKWIIWSVLGAGAILFIVGVLLLIWGSAQRETDRMAERENEQQVLKYNMEEKALFTGEPTLFARPYISGTFRSEALRGEEISPIVTRELPELALRRPQRIKAPLPTITPTEQLPNFPVKGCLRRTGTRLKPIRSVTFENS